jgi:hypothetical protein
VGEEPPATMVASPFHARPWHETRQTRFVFLKSAPARAEYSRAAAAPAAYIYAELNDAEVAIVSMIKAIRYE